MPHSCSFSPPAFALTSVKYTGDTDDGGEVAFSLEETGKKDKPVRIEDAFAYHVKFTCFNGERGRTDYNFFPAEPIDVDIGKKAVTFEGRYKSQTEIDVFKGEFLPGKQNDGDIVVNKAKGKLRAARSEGGLDFACTPAFRSPSPRM